MVQILARGKACSHSISTILEIVLPIELILEDLRFAVERFRLVLRRVAICRGASLIPAEANPTF